MVICRCQENGALLLVLLAALHCYCLLAPLQGLETKEVQSRGHLKAPDEADLKRRNLL